GGPFFDDVDDLAAVQHGQVGVMAGPVDQPGQRQPGQPLQRGLTAVAGGQLVGAQSQAVAAFVGQVHHEPVGDQRVQQVVGGGPGEPDVTADGGGGHRLGLLGQVAQDGQ